MYVCVFQKFFAALLNSNISFVPLLEFQTATAIFCGYTFPESGDRQHRIHFLRRDIYCVKRIQRYIIYIYKSSPSYLHLISTYFEIHHRYVTVSALTCMVNKSCHIIAEI